MAANYTASTITIFLNIVGSKFWRLNSFLMQKNFHVTCSYGECKKYDYLNNTLIMGKLYKKISCVAFITVARRFDVYISELHECHRLA